VQYSSLSEGVPSLGKPGTNLVRRHCGNGRILFAFQLSYLLSEGGSQADDFKILGTDQFDLVEGPELLLQ
jgi:hypothetical protein